VQVIGITSTRVRFNRRARLVLGQGTREADAAIDALVAQNAAKGALQSGATLKASMRIIEERSTDALDQALSEASKLIEHRGRKWRRAIAGIRDGLDAHDADRTMLMQKPLNLADRAGSPSARNAVDREMGAITSRLRQRLADYSEGWTAPLPKPWKDRRPLIYAILLLLLGAAGGLLAPATKRWLGLG
jgi:hypothetical protein